MSLMIVEGIMVEEVTMQAVLESLCGCCVEVSLWYCTTLLYAVCLTEPVVYKAVVDSVRTRLNKEAQKMYGRKKISEADRRDKEISKAPYQKSRQRYLSSG